MPRRPATSQAGRWDDISPDRGCRYAPKCVTCPWARCVLALPADERRLFRLAYRTLETFRAPPDRALPAD